MSGTAITPSKTKTWLKMPPIFPKPVEIVAFQWQHVCWHPEESASRPLIAQKQLWAEGVYGQQSHTHGTVSINTHTTIPITWD